MISLVKQTIIIRVKEIPKEYTEKLKNRIENARKTVSGPAVAAFDADGTCWFSDVGRDFFDHQVKQAFFPSEKVYQWTDYEALEAKDINLGLAWMAQILAGFSLDKVRSFAEKCINWSIPNYIEHQKEVIALLNKLDVDVYIVTASVKWSVEPAAEVMGIKSENVIGVETSIKDGLITDELSGPVTWREGKVDALLKATGGVNPFFVSGNTMSDVPLLHSSTALRSLMHSAKDGEDLFNTENQALELAKEQDWHFADCVRGEFN